MTSALKGARSSVRAIRWRTRRRLQHTLPSGVRVEIGSPSDWFVYNEVFVDGEYDAVLDALIASPAPSPIVLDLGANVGLFTLRLMDRWLRSSRASDRLRVFCVEGAPSTFTTLTRNLDQPRLRDSCSLHHGLAGERSGSADISTSANTGLNSIIDRSPSLARVQVPFLDLTRIVPAGERIALLKCDIEGAEELFLGSYPDLLARVDLIVIEWHHLHVDLERCRTFLQRAGLTRRSLLKIYGDDCSLESFSRT